MTHPRSQVLKTTSRMSTEKFKEFFKVGDNIEMYSTGIKGVITAIGEIKFLYKRINYINGDECAATMTAASGYRKWT